MLSINDISTERLRRAIELKEQIERLQQELDELFGAPGAPSSGGVAKTGRRRMSAAGRARIAAAARARWARIRGTKTEAGSNVSSIRKRRGMSAAGRARIAAAQRARWAKIKGR